MVRSPAKGMQAAAWLIFAASFALYMFKADRVYHALSGKSYIVKRLDSLSPRPEGNLQLRNVFDHAPVNNKFEEGKGFRAQFGKVANGSGKAEARVFFRSRDAVYEVIENRHSLWAHTMKIAVNVFASTSGLENGVYTLGLYLRDDEGERFAWLNSSFERVPGGPVNYIASPVALAPARASENLRFAIESADGHHVKGWVVLADADMADYNAYVTITGDHGISRSFYAPLFTRMDVASMHGDVRAANSGFEVRFSRDELPEGECAIRLAVQSRQSGEVIESVQEKPTRPGRPGGPSLPAEPAGPRR